MAGFFVFSGESLRQAREARHMSREQLAIASKLSASAITIYENGYRSPSRAALLRIAAALSVEPRVLVTDDPMFEVAQ